MKGRKYIKAWTKEDFLYFQNVSYQLYDNGLRQYKVMIFMQFQSLRGTQCQFI